MSPRASSEQRRDSRRLIDIVLNKYVNGEPHLCRAANVSRGGMLLHRVFEPDRLHHAVVLEFQLPGRDEVLRAEGMALLGSPEGRSCGVRFTHLPRETSALLEQFLGALGPVVPAPRHVTH